MKSREKPSRKETLARDALRRRVLCWYTRFNSQRWSDCYRVLDPWLVRTGKVHESAYTESLNRFHSRYGAIHPWHVRISLHMNYGVSASRPFAYVYTVWKDDRHDFHMFRERWVRDGNRWYTRVAGLVVNDAAANQRLSTTATPSRAR
jgi:hypothetical protein